MTRQIINVGTSPNSNTGDPIRTAFIKINNNFEQLFDEIAVLGGLELGDRTIEVSVKGSVISADDVVLVDAESGKITAAAIPNTVPLVYNFRVNFDLSGNLVSVTDLPLEWTAELVNNTATIHHTVATRHPLMISYWGLAADGRYSLRYPTGGYQSTRPAELLSEFTINVTAGSTGAQPGAHALVTVLF